MDLLLGMVRQKVHVPMITKYARVMATVQVRVLAIIIIRIVYGINTGLYYLTDFMNLNCNSDMYYRV